MTRRVLSLDDSNWRFGSVEQKPFGAVNDLRQVTEWLPARVPGDVRLDLLRNGKISDPFYAANNDESQWVDARDWWYERSVDAELELVEDERAFLIFEGIDYQSAVFFNDKPLGRHVGMFSRQVYKLPSAINCQPSVVSVRIWGSDALPKLQATLAQKLWAQIIRPLYRPPEHPFPDRYATLKCQMQFGWDFAPRLRTCGIWDKAHIVVVHSVLIEDAFVKAKVKNEKENVASVAVTLTLDSDREQMVRVTCNVRLRWPSAKTETFAFDMFLERGKQAREIEFDLANAHCWNPWDRGDPNLYDIEIHIESKTGQLFDSLTETIGVRDFKIARTPHSPANQEPWQFVINGKREFLRGANWVPLDAIPGRITRDDYALRLRQVRDANINFLRVWGGGLREKRAFYDLCDELGILVWQEFPFAGAILDRFPRDRAFLNHSRDECGAIVRALCNHPSLVMWCGGNEFNTRGNSVIVKTLRQVVERNDGTRPFKPASPYRDESHNWSVWHRFANLRDYRKDTTPFLSEFGLQALPSIETLKEFLPDDARQAPHPLWDYHHADVKKLVRYAESVNPNINSVEAFVDASQRAQAFAHQIAIEHIRRRKPQTTGVAIWQFNDCWPAISWSVVDYFGIPKRAYDELKKLYSPVLASFDYPLISRKPSDTVRGDIWLINDLRASFENAALHAFHNGDEIYTRHITIEPDSASRIDALEIKLGQGANTLRLKVNCGPVVQSDHEYDLNFCDVGEMNPIGALFFAIGKRLMK